MKVSLVVAVLLCQTIFSGQWVAARRSSKHQSGGQTLDSPSSHQYHRLVVDRLEELLPVSESPYYSSTSRNVDATPDMVLSAIDPSEGSGDETAAPIHPAAVAAVETLEHRRKRQLDEPLSNEILLGLKERNLLKYKKKIHKTKADQNIFYNVEAINESDPLTTTTETVVASTTDTANQDGLIIYFDDTEDHESSTTDAVADDPPSDFSYIYRLFNLFRLWIF